MKTQKNHKKFIHIFIIIFLIAPLWANFPLIKLEKRKNILLPFLLLQGGPRASAMGKAYTAVTDDVNAIYFNPAALALLTHNEVNFMIVDWYTDISLLQITYGCPFLKGGIGLGEFFVTSGEIERRNEKAELSGNFVITQHTMNFSYGKKINKWILGGINLKFPSEKIDKTTYTLGIFDIGIILTRFNQLNLGLVFKNLGGTEVGMSLPFQIKIGGSYKPVNQFLKGKLLLASDLTLAFNEKKSLNVGVEYTYLNKFKLRGGWIFEGEEQGGYFGIGVNIKTSCLDYALNFHNLDLGATHYFAWTLLFGGEIEKAKVKKIEENLRIKVEKELNEKIKLMAEMYYNQGQSYLDKNLLSEAIDAFEKVLIWQPDHILAEEKIEEARRKLQIKEEENEVKEYIKLGKEKFERGNYLEAVMEWKLALKIDKNNLEVLKLIDIANQKIEEEEIRLTKGKNIKLRTYFKTGIAYYTTKKYNKAIAEWKEIEKIDPEYPNLKNYIQQAEKKLKEEINKLLNEGKKFYEEKKFDSALKKFIKVCDLDLENKEAKEFINILKEKIGELSKEHFNKGIEYFNNKKYYQAKYEFEIALKYTPSKREIEEYLEKIKNKIKEIKKEEVDFSLAKKKYYEGVSFYMNGELKKAIECWQEVLNINPHDENVKRTLERVLLKLEQIKQ